MDFFFGERNVRIKFSFIFGCWTWFPLLAITPTPAVHSTTQWNDVDIFIINWFSCLQIEIDSFVNALKREMALNK